MSFDGPPLCFRCDGVANDASRQEDTHADAQGGTNTHRLHTNREQEGAQGGTDPTRSRSHTDSRGAKSRWEELWQIGVVQITCARQDECKQASSSHGDQRWRSGEHEKQKDRSCQVKPSDEKLTARYFINQPKSK